MKKKLIVGLTLAAAVIATPAMSQTRGYAEYMTGPMTAPGYSGYAYAPRGFGAYGSVGPMVNGRTFFSDEYQGTDPDPFIRLQLRRDPTQETY